MSKSLTPEDRKRLAHLLDVSPASLYQATTGRGTPFSPARCVELERESGLELRRWDLRPDDWFEIWPELIGTKGAPKVPKAGAKA